jgi:hypothetical protein
LAIVLYLKRIRVHSQLLYYLWTGIAPPKRDEETGQIRRLVRSVERWDGDCWLCVVVDGLRWLPEVWGGRGWQSHSQLAQEQRVSNIVL